MTGTDTIPDRWDDDVCRGFDDVELLVYRSNLLGADLRITNFAGGNTSAKIHETDPLTGESVDVLWVKGSGGDLGSVGRDGFASLYLARLLELETHYRGLDHEDAMVAFLPHCTFGLNPRAASIDTPLHAYLPYRHVDHMHPDGLIAIAAAKHGEALTREIFSGELAWIPWQRPGFDLGLRLREICAKRPGLRGVVLGGHGLFTWGETSKACYRTTLDVIRRAANWLRDHASAPAFGGAARESLAPEARRHFALGILPELRGELCVHGADKIAHFVDSDETLEFVNSTRFEELSALGTSCPDHFLRTKIRPMVIRCDPHTESIADVVARLPVHLEAYRRDYAAYYDRCHDDNSPPMRDPSPVVVLVPSVGMMTFANDKATARIAGEFYVNAIHVMRGASSVSDYVGLSELEAFRIEYWELEEAKLRRLPPPRALAGKVAVVTGGAGGIGMATARRLMRDGACVVLLDSRADALEVARATLAERSGGDAVSDVVRTAVCDVTDEESVARGLACAIAEFGGADILVANAGIASASPVEDTTLETWNLNLSVLTTGYFLAAREAFRLFKRQARGGSIVFVGSKNALAASPGAAAYCTAKAAELHLARCLALEGAAQGIRVNTVNPDAVLTGSQIWSGEWRKDRAAAYGIDESELEEHYRNRSLLRRSVLPEDVAEAVCFFAGPLAQKSTGNILNVDAGNAGAFPR